MMLGPASSENEGAGSGTGRVRAFSLVIRACWCWCGPGSGNVRHGGPTSHNLRQTGAPAAPRPTSRAAGAAGRAVISRSPSPRHEPRPGSGTHHRPGGRPTTRGPGEPTRATARGGRPHPRGTPTDE